MTGGQLRKLLDRAGLSQRGAAKALVINERTMRKYVAGDAEVPKMVELAILCLAEHHNQEIKRLMGVVDDATRGYYPVTFGENMSLPSSKTAGSPKERAITLPVSVALLIRQVFLPRNPNKMRNAHPDVVAAVKRFIAAVEEQ